MSFTSKDAIELILKFVNSKLNGDINELRFFSFTELENDPQFGRVTGGEFDEDDTELARALMFLIWSVKLPDISYEEIGFGRKYRGDTINTYNTLFGKDDKFKDYIDDKELIAKILAFKEKYVTIGNFMLMPNRSGGNQISTINCYRGSSSGWRDYFDKFLIELDKCLTENTRDSDNKLFILKEKNGFYFQEINTIQKFCEINYLDPYLLNNKVLSLFSPYLYHWKYPEINNEVKNTYSNFAISYIKQVEEIIDQRSHKMLQIIIDKMKGTIQ
jgi:hypothetical protein